MAKPAIHAARVVKTVSDTQQPMVPAEPVVGVAPNPVHRFWAFPLAGVSIVVLTAILLGSFFTASRISEVTKPYAIVPSDAEEVQSHVDLQDVESYPVDGDILFVTIRQPELSLLSWLMFRGDDDIQLRTYEEVYGTRTPQQVQTRGRRQMFTAQQAAEFVALSKLGFPVDKDPIVLIDQIVCLVAPPEGQPCDPDDEAPVGRVLQADDELLSIDGAPVTTIDDIVAALAGKQPGDQVDVEYNRLSVDGTQTGTVELIESPDDPTRTIMGIVPAEDNRITNSPFPIEFNLAGVGGPSAGLAFTLTLIDELTPGSLTGGNTVAVTGEINVDGEVGAIGGLAQKASAVRQTGTKYFLVPAGQSEDSIAAAREVVGDDVTIIPVATLDEALQALAGLGGNADDIGQPGEDYVAPS